MNKNLLIIILLSIFAFNNLNTRNYNFNTALDRKVKRFLKNHYWRNMNIPVVDGQKLFDIIIKNGYKNAVEIGTSTGHSAIWIAWAMSKTKGRLITIEINRYRYKKAVENFRKAGLLKYIDARLANAHYLVPRLRGRFDFVFSDADKSWYKKYFIALDPKLKPGACYVSHNVSLSGDFWNSRPYIKYLLSRKNYKTTFFTKGSGMSISYKKSR